MKHLLVVIMITVLALLNFDSNITAQTFKATVVGQVNDTASAAVPNRRA